MVAPSNERHVMHRIALAALKVTVLAIAVYLAGFYFRLGWFLMWVFGAGVVLAVVITRPEWKSHRRFSFIGVLVVAIAYTGIHVLIFTVTTTRSHETFLMRWSEKPRRSADQQAEVVLEFARFPGAHVGVYSDSLRNYLASTGSDTVRVTFDVTRDIGCLRGFHEERIGSLTFWPSAAGSGGYAGSIDHAPFPWSDPWWCP